MPVPLCVTILCGLFLAFYVALWLRDRELRLLLKAADSSMRTSNVQTEWAATYDVVLYSMAQSRRIGLIGANTTVLPAIVQARYGRYRLIRLLPAGLFAAIMLFGILSHRLC